MRFIEYGLRACPADDGAGSAPLARRQTGAAGRKWRWGSCPTARETFNGDGFITTRDNPATPENDVEIMQENHYYPFGMNHDGRWFGPQDPENRYTYNGKEYTPELGLDWYDYGARWYDAALGRWGQVDPMADLYTDIASYSYAANSPTNVIDLDGNSNGFVIETIKVITHSMGAAFGKGFVLALLYRARQRGIKGVPITLVADFDPFQAGSFGAIENVYTQQFTHRRGKKKRDNNIWGDWSLLANKRQRNLEVYREDPENASHNIWTFFNDIGRLREGTYIWNGREWILQNENGTTNE